jgi:Tol biopolymer transport system component
MIMKRMWILILVILILAAAAGAVYWFGSPYLQAFTPPNAALDVPAGAVLRLTFSRSMLAESVKERLTVGPNIPGSLTWEGKTLLFTPDRPWPAGSNVQVSLAKGARASGWLSLQTREETAWAFTVRQPRLLYLYPSNAASNLYLYDPRTQESKPLTNILGGVFEYDVTVDGTAIYYSTQNNLNGSDIYRLELGEDLSNPQATLVLACQQSQCRAPRVSPQEDFLAYERTSPAGNDQTDYPQVWVVGLSKHTPAPGQATITPEANPRLAGDPLHQTIQPDWSQNGILSFYDTNQKAFVILDPRSGESTTLPNQTGEPGSWDPNGTAYVAPEIFFNQDANSQTSPNLKPIASSHLLRFNVEEGTIQDLTQVENLEDTSPAFSPDGNFLAFARKFLDITHWTPGRQLWIMRVDGTESRQLTDSPEYNHFDFAWDPTGSQLAFVRFDQTAPTNLPTIWTYNLDKGYESELIPGGYSPHWMP